MKSWQIARVPYSGARMQHLLKEGWEPFAVTGGTLDDYVWLRRERP